MTWIEKVINKLPFDTSDWRKSIDGYEQEEVFIHTNDGRVKVKMHMPSKGLAYFTFTHTCGVEAGTEALRIGQQDERFNDIAYATSSIRPTSFVMGRGAARVSHPQSGFSFNLLIGLLILIIIIASN